LKKQISYDDSPTLYLIPTPIGNFEDMTFRAINTIKQVDILYCEDTRETIKLLNHFSINKKLVSCYKYNENNVKNKIVEDLKSGKNVGLVSDQGCPIISDPGFVVSKEVIDNNFNVVALPGASAITCSVMTCGIDANHFLFYGFLNSNKSKRCDELEKLKFVEFPQIYYLSVHDFFDYIKDFYDIFGDRYCSISHEISKLHESIYRGNLSEMLKIKDELKGEYVIVVDGYKNNFDFNNMSIKNHVKLYLDDGETLMNSFKKVAKDRGVSKSIIYKEYYKEDSD